MASLYDIKIAVRALLMAQRAAMEGRDLTETEHTAFAKYKAFVGTLTEEERRALQL
jgi:hypothetical protein